jgi:hypothetical protein
MYAVEFMYLQGHANNLQIDSYDQYESVEEAVAATLNLWWEEESGPFMFWVRNLENGQVYATLTSQQPCRDKDGIVGMVYVQVRREDGSMEPREYRVRYLTDDGGYYDGSKVDVIDSDAVRAHFGDRLTV